MENNRSELVERYITDNLTAEEKMNFEQQLQSNPELAAEVQFQKTVINGIRQYRKMQLKSQLGQVQVGGGVLSTTFSKILVGGVSAVVLLGSYWWLKPQNIDEIIQPQIEQTFSPATAIQETQVDDQMVVDSSIQPIEESKPKAAEHSTSDTKKPVSSKAAGSKTKATDQSIEITVPQPVMPDEDAFETNIKSASDPIAGTTRSIMSSTAIDVVNDGDQTLRYRFRDNQLSLYGDFTKETYQILEVNHKLGRTVYLYYLNQYYELAPVTSVTKLKAIVNEKQIGELKTIRDHK